MSTAQAILSVLGALVALAVVGGGLWAVFRSSAQDATITRLRAEVGDYKGRIEFIEPRFAAAEEQNRILRELHNPSAAIGGIDEKATRILRILDEQHATLQEIENRMPPRGT